VRVQYHDAVLERCRRLARVAHGVPCFPAENEPPKALEQLSVCLESVKLSAWSPHFHVAFIPTPLPEIRVVECAVGVFEQPLVERRLLLADALCGREEITCAKRAS